MDERYFVLVPLGSIIALLFAFFQARKVLGFPEGNALMQKISLSVRKGANAYLKRQYSGVALFFVFMFFNFLDNKLT